MLNRTGEGNARASLFPTRGVKKIIQRSLQVASAGCTRYGMLEPSDPRSLSISSTFLVVDEVTHSTHQWGPTLLRCTAGSYRHIVIVE